MQPIVPLVWPFEQDEWHKPHKQVKNQRIVLGQILKNSHFRMGKSHLQECDLVAKICVDGNYPQAEVKYEKLLQILYQSIALWKILFYGFHFKSPVLITPPIDSLQGVLNANNLGKFGATVGKLKIQICGWFEI